ncbi:MAG: PorV/PorQ family protein [Candidatus Hydrogenedentota bacterium]
MQDNKRSKKQETENIIKDGKKIMRKKDSKIERFKDSKIISAFCILLMLLASTSYASRNDAGENAASFLEVMKGAVPAAMGEAFVAVTDYPMQGMFYNPGQLVYLKRKNILFTHQNLIQDIDYESLMFGIPLNQESVIGVGLDYVDLGKVKRTTIQSFNQGINLGTASGNDLMLSAYYARPITESLGIGAGIKWVREKLDEKAANSVSIDAGLIYKLPIRELTFGVSLRNLGTKLKFYSDKENIPLTLQTGFQYLSPNKRFRVCIDADKVRREEIGLHCGGELMIKEILFLRMGYNSAIDVDNGLTLGFGIKYYNIGFDYAYVPFGDIGRNHRFSGYCEFGKSYKEEETTSFIEKIRERFKKKKRVEIIKEEAKEEKEEVRVIEPRYGPFIGVGESKRDWLDELLPIVFKTQIELAGKDISPANQLAGRYYIYEEETIIKIHLEIDLIDEAGTIIKTLSRDGELNRIIILIQELIKQL